MAQLVVYANADTACLQIGANSNYGSSSNISICATSGDLRFGAVNFDLSGLPSVASIDSATLEIIKYSGTPTMTLRAERFTGPWSETGITYNNTPATVYDGDPTISVTSTNQTYSMDVKKIVQAWTSGSSRYGIKLVPTTGSLTYFRSREYSSTSIKLTINYSTAPNLSVNVGDVWRTTSGMYVNVGDVWRPVTEMYVNVGDVWKRV